MNFRYTRVGSDEFPLLRVGVHMPAMFFWPNMLIDSGATDTLISRGQPEEGGVELDLNSPVELLGFGSGAPLIGYPCNVELSVAGHHFHSRVIAVDEDWSPIPVLGHRDFFHHFRVTFESWNSTFSVVPAR